MGDGCTCPRPDDLIGIGLDGRQQVALFLGFNQLQGQSHAAETGDVQFEQEGRVTVTVLPAKGDTGRVHVCFVELSGS